MEGFYWLVEGVLAGCRRPGQRWPIAAHDAAAALEEDLRALHERGVGAVLSLTEEPLPLGTLEAAGIATLHLPVPDFTAPSPDQLRQALAFIARHRSEGRAVAVHCLAGIGRTGTVLAAFLIQGGQLAPAAIAAVRAVRPGAIESREQVAALEAFATRRDWGV
jgi:atypical dual specificity phosphatase